MIKDLSKQQEEKLKQLIQDHNKLCDKFDEEMHAIMDEIYKICEPVGISASRISKYENGREVTRIHLAPKFTMTDLEQDEKWLKSLWEEDDRL